MEIKSRVWTTLAAAAVVVAACGGSATPAPAVDWKTATSAGAGGVDAVCAAGKAEGHGQPHRHPARLGELRPDDHRLHREVRDQGPVRPAGRRQPGRDQRRGAAGRHRPPARHLRPRHGRCPCQHRHVRAVQGGDLGRHPGRQQGGHRPLDQQLHRLPDASATTPRSATIATVADLADATYKGKVALNGDPTQGGRRLQRRRPGRAGQRRLRRQHRSPASTSSRSSADSGNLHPGRPGSGNDRVGPDPDRHRLDLQQRPPDRRARAEGHHLEASSSRATRLRSPRTTTARSTRTLRTRRPRAAGWSTSSPTPARTPGSRASPCRSALPRCRRPARLDKDAFAAINPPTTTPVVLTPEQTDAAKALPHRPLEVHHHPVALEH